MSNPLAGSFSPDAILRSVSVVSGAETCTPEFAPRIKVLGIVLLRPARFRIRASGLQALKI
jgi:hypothetical protein